jgi:hypothetical protein
MTRVSSVVATERAITEDRPYEIAYEPASVPAQRKDRSRLSPLRTMRKKRKEPTMNAIVQLFLAVQAVVFAFAAGAHFGIVGNRDDPAASTAESVIAIVLVTGLVLSLVNPLMTRTYALAAQGFALLGTLVGFTLVLTVGPTTAFDVTMHAIMLALLVTGLAVTYRSAGDAHRQTPVPS